MHIFIDETGPFGGIGQFPSVSLIGALIVPDERLAKLEKGYGKIRANLPKDDKGEVKGLLNEQQVDSVVPLLLHHSALFEAVAIDLGVYSEEALKAFPAQQAEKMTANLTQLAEPFHRLEALHRAVSAPTKYRKMTPIRRLTMANTIRAVTAILGIAATNRNMA